MTQVLIEKLGVKPTDPVAVKVSKSIFMSLELSGKAWRSDELESKNCLMINLLLRETVW